MTDYNLALETILFVIQCMHECVSTSGLGNEFAISFTKPRQANHVSDWGEHECDVFIKKMAKFSIRGI